MARIKVIPEIIERTGLAVKTRSRKSPLAISSNLRLGLCCLFAKHPIHFRTTTATSLLRLKPADRMLKLSQLCRANAESLMQSLQFCAVSEIGCFRITSSILPVKTHPDAGYSVESLPDGDAIIDSFKKCGRFATEHNIRTVFHPDQFVVLNSPRPDVVLKSVEDLEYHAEVAEWVHADVINIHGGGGYDDKPAALARFARNLKKLTSAVRSRLTVENDDKVFTPSDLLPICRSEGLPLVYDVHHHRCLSDDLSIEQATSDAIKTWDREPLFHISSPLNGWSGSQPNRHHDYIDAIDFPEIWKTLSVTVEVEAKAKELAIAHLRNELRTDSDARPARRRTRTH